MNARVTIGFVVVAALLGALVFGLDRAGVKPPEPTPVGQQQQFDVLQFDDQKLAAVNVRSGETSVRFQKDGDGWKLAETGEAANRIPLTGLMIRLSAQKASSQIPDTSTDPNGYGLNSPAAEITMELDDGTTHGLQFGDRTPLGATVYAKKPNEPTVYLVPAQLLTDVQRLANEPKEPPTPTPRPTSTATPTPDVTATPTATPTP